MLEIGRLFDKTLTFHSFSEQGTRAIRVHECLEITSDNFKSLVEHTNAKLTSIKHFYPNLPWDIVLSLVEYDIQNTEAKNRICLHSPTCDSGLLKLLGACDASKMNKDNRTCEPSRKRVNNFREDFQRKCGKCHRYAHKQYKCKQEVRSTVTTPDNNLSAEKAKTVTIKTCTYCHRKGHTEDDS